MLAIDHVHVSSNVNFLLCGNDLKNGSCNEDTDTLYRLSNFRRCDRLRDYCEYLDKKDSIDYLDANQRLLSDASKPTVFEQSHEMVSSVSSMMYPLYFDNETDFEDAEFDATCLFLLPRGSRSQDDCLNSASHPKLFTSQYQQQWSVRAYKFQLGLINTREVSGPTNPV